MPAGSILAVKGRNGAGKTTLARLIMGLAEPVIGKDRSARLLAVCRTLGEAEDLTVLAAMAQPRAGR